MKILLAITFVFGVIHLLTWTPLFRRSINGIVEVITGVIIKEDNGVIIRIILKMLNNYFFYFSLIFQAWYWIFK